MAYMSAGQEMSAGDPVDAVRLAEECLARYESTRERADLASADGLARAAVARMPGDNPELANALSVASTVARACYQVDGRVSDLDRGAVRPCRAARRARQAARWRSSLTDTSAPPTRTCSPRPRRSRAPPSRPRRQVMPRSRPG